MSDSRMPEQRELWEQALKQAAFIDPCENCVHCSSYLKDQRDKCEYCTHRDFETAAALLRARADEISGLQYIRGVDKRYRDLLAAIPLDLLDKE